MNQSFSLSRFGLVGKLYLAEHLKGYLISLGLCFGGMALLMLPILVTRHYNDLLYVLHVSAMLGVMLGSSLYTGTAFNAYHNPAQGIPALMLPASRLEKFLVIFLANLFFVVLVAVSFYYLHHGLIELANQSIPATARKYPPIPAFILRFAGFSYFLIQGWVFLGSLYFPKNAYIKSMGALFLLLVVAFLFNQLLGYQLTGHPDHIIAFPFIYWDVVDGQFYHVDYPALVKRLIQLFLALVVVALWAITYVRLKEKEI